MATFNFGGAILSNGAGLLSSPTDGTVTETDNTGQIEPGDAVTFTGFENNIITNAGVGSGGFYLGSIILDGTTFYVFGADADYTSNSNLMFVSDGNPTFDAALEAQIVANSRPSLTAQTACFATGTLISTPDGEGAVEDLQVNDPIMTAGGSANYIKWIGRRTRRTCFDASGLQPVRIGKAALGHGLPHRDLIVTADHGMVIDGYVINASALVNSATIQSVPTAELEDHFIVYHIETENHEAIFANGAPAETFIDVAGRRAFDNYQEYVDLYGAERIIPQVAMPRISSARLVPPAVRNALNRQSMRMLEKIA